jgi:hypothetical protein
VDDTRLVSRTALVAPGFALALAPLLALTACADPASSRAQGADVAPAADLAEVPTFAVGPTGVAADVTPDDCQSAVGPVTASGTASNSGKFARDLVVVVTWVVPGATSVPVARELAEIDDVAPGARSPWSVTGDVPPGPAVACVVTAYAGQLA